MDDNQIYWGDHFTLYINIESCCALEIDIVYMLIISQLKINVYTVLIYIHEQKVNYFFVVDGGGDCDREDQREEHN